MAIVVGSVAVDVVPNATSFARDLRAQIEGPVDAIGQEVGQNLSDAVMEHLSDAIPDGLAGGIPESAGLGDEAGARFADAFSTQVRTKIDAALKSLPPIDLDADISQVEGKVGEVRAMLEQLGELDSIDLTANDDEVIATLTELSAYLEDVRRDAETPTAIIFDAQEAQASLDGLIAKMQAAKAAAAELNAELAVEDDLIKAMGEAQAAQANGAARDLENEERLAESMAADWENVGSSASGAGSSISGMAIALGALAVVAAPILGVLVAGAADLVIGIKNAHVETDDLSSAWQKLEASAGSSMQSGLQGAVDHLASALPALDPLVETLSADLGNALDEAAAWLDNGGAKTIVDYLQTEIPIVGGLFESLGGALGAFISATQGPANVLLKTFTDIFNAITYIQKFTGAGTPTSSPYGSSGTSQAVYAVNPGGTAAPKPVTTADYFIGIAHDIISGGGQGPAKSAPKVTPAYVPQLPTGGTAAFRHATGTYGTGEGQGPTLDSETMQKATAGLDDNTQAYAKNAAAAHETVSAYLAAQTAAQAFAAQTAQNTADMQAENNAAGILQQALTGFGGNVLGVAQSETAFHSAITQVNSSLKTNGDSLDENTDKGQKNRTAIAAAVAAAQQHMLAVADQTDSTQAGTDAYNADIAALKAQLTATGMSKAAIDAYIDSIDKIKPHVLTQLEIDTAQADAAIASLNSQLSTLGKRATGIEVTSEAVLRRAAAGADGMFLQFYANGGMENHVAQMASGDTMRIWAEPETEGESYIPHAASKRGRSEAILAQTANLFGGTYVPKGARNFADGMVLRGSSSGMGDGGAGGHSHPISVLLDGRKITKVVNEQNGRNGRL